MTSSVATIMSLVNGKKFLSFKLNNASFPPLPFPSASKSVSSISGSMPFITARKPFPFSINTRSTKSFAVVTFSVPCIVQGKFFPKLKLNPSKSSILDHACNIPVKHIHWSIYKSAKLFESIVVNVNVVSVRISHHFHEVKSVFHHQHVSSLAKSLTVDTVTDTLNVFKVVEFVSPTRDTCRVFPFTHKFISIPGHISCLENDNIANSDLPTDKFSFFF